MPDPAAGRPRSELRASERERRADRETLQRVLREAKAGSAAGQDDLDDPRRAAMVQRMVELKERAEALGLADVAAGAQAALEEMAAAEAALRTSLVEADAAHDLVLEVLVREQEDRD